MKQMLRRWLGVKDSQARIALSYNQVGQPQNTPRNYEQFAKQGFQKNVIVYRCISMIAQACGGIELEVYSKRKGGEPTEMPDHPLKKLLDRPNPLQGRSAFIETVIGFHRLTGNTFTEAVGPNLKSPPMELWPTRPDKIKIVPAATGYPKEYQFVANGITKRWEVDPVSMKSMLNQIKTFHPTNDWWGLSPLEAAMLALDQNNAGQSWNLSMLQNSAQPSGILSVKSTEYNPGGSLTEKQFTDLKSSLDESAVDMRAKHRPLILEGGLEWTQVSLSPKEMDFLKGKNITATDIAQVYGIPPELLGIGEKTYSNYAEARMSFYEDTVLPLMDVLMTEYNHWLAPMFGDGIYIAYDKDDIEALAPKREAKFTSLKDASFLQVNEKREAAGYEPVDGGDVFLVGDQVVENLMDIASGGSDETDPKPDDKPGEGAEAKPNATGDDTNVQQTVLNGAQIAALQEIVRATSAGEIPRASAVNMIVVSYNVTPAIAEGILGEAGNGFVPTKPDAGNPPPPPADAADTGEEDMPEDETAADTEEFGDPTEEDDDEKAMAWKTFNLLNDNERKQSWRKQNARRKRLEASFERDIESDLVEMARDLGAAAKTAGDARAKEYALLRAIDEHTPVLERTLKRHIRYTVEDFGQHVFSQAKTIWPDRVETKATRKWDDWAKRYIQNHTAKTIGEISGTTRKKVTETVKRLVSEAVLDGSSNDEIANELADSFASLSKGRARTIARTEVAMASNNASIQAVKTLEIPGMVKEWISAKDDRVRTLENSNGEADHEVMDGVEEPLDDKFSVPPDTTMEGPGDTSAPIAQLANCRCVLGFKSRSNGGA